MAAPTIAARNHTTRASGRDAYHQWLLGGKTVGIIGLGGIGSALAKLAKGMGMRTLGTRRSAAARAQNTDGVDELFRASSWQSVFEGMGLHPRGYCPRVGNLDDAHIAATLRTARAAIAGMVEHLPTHEQFLSTQVVS